MNSQTSNPWSTYFYYTEHQCERRKSNLMERKGYSNVRNTNLFNTYCYATCSILLLVYVSTHYFTFFIVRKTVTIPYDDWCSSQKEQNRTNICCHRIQASIHTREKFNLTKRSQHKPEKINEQPRLQLTSFSYHHPLVPIPTHAGYSIFKPNCLLHTFLC